MTDELANGEDRARRLREDIAKVARGEHVAPRSPRDFTDEAARLTEACSETEAEE
jgi:hypothetical protein